MQSVIMRRTWQTAADFAAVSGPFQRRILLLGLAQTFSGVAVP